MNIEERTKRIESLSDIKRIRFNTVNRDKIIITYISAIVFLSFALFLLLQQLLIETIFFTTLGIIFTIMHFQGSIKNREKEDEFLLKYDHL